jgi:putative endonuclease
VTPQEAGRRAEALAADLLERGGMRILARNWRQAEGDQAELDLVADDGGTCVFVEVRARTGETFGHPLEAIGSRKRAQVIRAARLFLASDAIAWAPSAGYRFDVVGVLFPEDGSAPQLHHVPNAFEVEHG